VAAVAFSPAGAPLASAAGAELALWSPRGRGAARHKARARSYYMRWMSSVALPGLGLRTPRLWAAGLAAAFSPKGAPPASVAGAALGWRGPNLLQPNPIISTHHHSAHIMRARSWPGGALAIAWSAGGRLLAVALAGGGVSLRSRSGAQAAALCTPGPVAAIAWRPPRCARGPTEPRLHAFARVASAGRRRTGSQHARCTQGPRSAGQSGGQTRRCSGTSTGS